MELLSRSKPVRPCISTGRFLRLRVCSVCELLPSFIPAAVRGFVCALFWCTQTCECGCLYVCEWSLTSCPCHARVHTLTPSHLLLYMCPPGGHLILSASVCLSCRHSIPLTPCMYHMQRETLFLSFTMETRHVLIPSSFPLSRPRAVCCRLCEGHGCLRTGVQSSRQAS